MDSRRLTRTPSEAPLFAPPAAGVESKFTVSSLTRAIKNVIEPAFADVVVEGELSNFTDHRSGHRYFTLKDPESQISAVLWKTRAVNFKLKDGLKVVCRGKISLYAPRGSYQLDVLQIRPVGVGELQRAYEQLCQKLRAEGLFDPARKRPLPKFPKVIGIVTSETGAAIRDMIAVFHRRYPLLKVILRPAQVQGMGCELDIARAIREFNTITGTLRPDVLIVGRGGGSLEDLWGFNEEAVARAVFSSAIPVISAVGHEVDTTISDMVADLRAPTPTAAAELATPDIDELEASIRGLHYSARQCVSQTISAYRRTFERTASPEALTARMLRRLSDLAKTIEANEQKGERSMRHTLERYRLRLERDVARLRTLGPHSTLDRGYALVESAEGLPITSVHGLVNGQRVLLQLCDGKAAAIVAEP